MPADRAELVERFSSFPARLAEAARAADGRPVPDGEWTPSEIVRHLMAVEGEVWLSRLATLVAGGEPHWSWTEPGPLPGFDDASLDHVLGLFGRLRASTVDFLRDVRRRRVGTDRRPRDVRSPRRGRVAAPRDRSRSTSTSGA